MTGPEFKKSLRRLGRTQIGFAKEIGASRRGVHHWADAGPPEPIVYLLCLLERYGVSASAAEPSDEKPADILGAMFMHSKSRGQGTQFIRSIDEWLEANRGE